MHKLSVATSTILSTFELTFGLSLVFSLWYALLLFLHLLVFQLHSFLVLSQHLELDSAKHERSDMKTTSENKAARITMGSFKLALDKPLSRDNSRN